jgi:hypothetical protein
MPNRGTDVATTLDERLRVAEMLSGSGMIPDTYRGRPGNVLAAEFAADALQIPLFTAFQHLHNIKGKVGMSAELMRVLVRRAGHSYDRWVEKVDGNLTAFMEIHLRGEAKPKRPVSFSLEEAVDAELVRMKDGKPFARGGKGDKLPWESHTEDMLQARVTSKAVRRHCPEVLAGMSYTPDELDEIANREGRITATVEQIPHQQENRPPSADKPVEASDPDREKWTADDLLLAVTQVDPADPDVKADLRLRRYWNEGKQDGVLNTVIDGLPLGAHILKAGEVTKKGQHYVPRVDAKDEVVDAEIVDGEPA